MRHRRFSRRRRGRGRGRSINTYRMQRGGGRL